MFESLPSSELWDAYKGGLRAGLTEQVLRSYSVTRFPTAELDVSAWVKMFRTCQHVDPDPRLTMCDASLTVYRGSPASRRTGLSWSLSLFVARVFALDSRFRHHHPASVWSVTADPACFLAQPLANEIIIDPRDLEPLEVMTPAEVSASFGLPAR